MENLVAFILLVERSVVIWLTRFYGLPGYGFIIGFKVYFGVSSRSKLIKFLFSRLFCENSDIFVLNTEYYLAYRNQNRS